MKKQEDRPIIMVDVQEEFDRLLAHKYRLIGYLDWISEIYKLIKYTLDKYVLKW